MDHGYETRFRQSEANGYAVYSRIGRLKSGNGGRIGFFDKDLECSGISGKAAEVVRSDCEFIAGIGDSVNVGGDEDKLGDISGIEVKQKTVTVLKRDGHRRFTRSVLKSKVVDSKRENGVDFKVDGSEGEAMAAPGSPKKKMEMKMSKNIVIKGRPTTVRELFETGLLEGYPVFYNGGKKGFPLRGTIKDGGIICTCSLCKGFTVVPPCKFEMHACKSYRRASQYICLENGKSLLDIVKECRKASVKALEETIQNFIGPMPVKESFDCRGCKKAFLATSSAKEEQLCDSCMVIVNSDADAECVKSGPSEPALASTISENTEVHNTPQNKCHQGRTKRKHLELVSDSKSSRRSSPPISTTKKGKWERTNMRSQSSFALSMLKGRNGSANGGKLVLCDGCPLAFHKECASLSCIPRGKWYCTYCQNMFQRERFVECNAVAAGRVLGIDAIEQIKRRCIRTVKSPKEAELIACAICRGYDFSKSGFGPRTVILCDQCEKEYHVDCFKKCKMSDLKEHPKGKWFCSVNCKRIYSALQNLLNSGAEKLPNATLDVVMRKREGKNLLADTDLDVRWRLLNGKNTSRETRVLLSQAVAIFHECFDPIVDSETGRDLIPSMVYGRNIRGQNFSGMHCAILTVNSTVVSVGILRIFGQEMAELPLAATRVGNQDKGYFQILFACIEKLLASLSVKLFVLPAADEAKSIWTKKFGFTAISEEQLSDYKKACWQMTTFKGTSMLEKQVLKCRIINHDKSDSMSPCSD